MYIAVQVIGQPDKYLDSGNQTRTIEEGWSVSAYKVVTQINVSLRFRHAAS